MGLENTVIKSTLNLTLVNGIVRLISILTMPFLTSLLSPEAYGLSAVVATTISLAAVIGVVGVDLSYIRAYNSEKSNIKKITLESFAWKFSISSSILSGLMIFLLWNIVAERYLLLPNYLGILVSIGVGLSILNTMCQVRARLLGKYKSLSLATLFGGIITPIVVVVLALWWEKNEIPLIIGQLTSPIVFIFILGAPKIKNIFSKTNLLFSEKVSFLKIGISSMFTAPLFWVITSMDKWFLSYYVDAGTVGIYSIGCSVATLGYMINNSLTLSWIPEITKAYEKNAVEAQIQLSELSKILISMLAIVWLSVTIFGGDIIRLLANDRFLSAPEIIPFIAGGVFFHGLMHISNAGLFIKRKLHYGLAVWVIGCFFSILLNVRLIPKFGMIGAAFVQLISMFMIAMGITFLSQRFYKVNYQYKFLLLILLFFCTCGYFLKGQLLSTPAQSIFIKLPIILILTLTTLYLSIGKLKFFKIINSLLNKNLLNKFKSNNS